LQVLFIKVPGKTRFAILIAFNLKFVGWQFQILGKQCTQEASHDGELAAMIFTAKLVRVLHLVLIQKAPKVVHLTSLTIG
jgi:hypothetical protein